MLRDLTRTDWLRILQIPEERVPAALILRGTRNLKRQYQLMLSCFRNVLEIGSPNGLFEDVLIGEIDGQPVGFACVYGASMASEITHVFGMLGSRRVIQTGNCGALADDLAAGDLFVAERACCGEGAAQYYKADGRWVNAAPALSAAAAPLAKRGSIYTTAALLAESAADLDRWHAEGFAAVDMETAATYAVAEHFGMERISVLFVFDNPRRKEHLLLADAEKDVRRQEGNERMRALAFELALSAARQSGTGRPPR
jgi:purine-nucleoside phosphorylase